MFQLLMMQSKIVSLSYIYNEHDWSESSIELVAGCKQMNNDSADLNEKELIIYIYIWAKQV